MEYLEIDKSRLEDCAAMELKLFPHESRADMEQVCREALASDRQTFFLCYDEGRVVGHVHAAIRVDYVEGSNSSPVGYLEAIYVEPEYRKRGVARELAHRAERWAAERGCVEMGSDTELRNLESQAFHGRIGYQEAEKNIHFIKKIGT